MARAPSQNRASAADLLRTAYRLGLGDDAAIDFAVAAMGGDHRQMIEAVWEAQFKIMGPN